VLDVPRPGIALDQSVLSLDIAEAAKFLKERAIVYETTCLGQFRYRMGRMQDRDPVDLRCLLRS
jgi:hypothetical protein